MAVHNYRNLRGGFLDVKLNFHCIYFGLFVLLKLCLTISCLGLA